MGVRAALSPAQLATVNVLQFLLNVSDRQAADAVRCRIDFKYALALKLDDQASTTVCCPTLASASLRATVPTGSCTSRRPVSRRPGSCVNAPRSAPIPPMSWLRCAARPGWSWSPKRCGPPGRARQHRPPLLAGLVNEE
ncbi:transposase [Streptomyces mirabilis]|uniref:transposase n=1 Tax=Streptomyces mirabilis TaxID=68239 RepID=UPI00371B77DD